MHLYSKDGEPVYEVPYADKKRGMRPATLRDAKKHNYFPSVTEILKILDKPGLNRWKEEQILMAALTIPRIEYEPEQAFIDRIKKDSREQAKIAAEKGQAIHKAVEYMFEDQIGKIDTSLYDLAKKVTQKIKDYFGVYDGWMVEESFACKAGYGGRVDLNHKKAEIVLDIKTKEVLEEGKKYAYDEHAMQLVGYSDGLLMPDARKVNAFVGYNGDVIFHEWENVDRERKMFYSCLDLWKHTKRHYPEV